RRPPPRRREPAGPGGVPPQGPGPPRARLPTAPPTAARRLPSPPIPGDPTEQSAGAAHPADRAGDGAGGGAAAAGARGGAAGHPDGTWRHGEDPIGTAGGRRAAGGVRQRRLLRGPGADPRPGTGAADDRAGAGSAGSGGAAAGREPEGVSTGEAALAAARQLRAGAGGGA